MNYDEMIAVIAAHRDGKPVERMILGSTWILIGPDHQFNFYSCNYRIKPEPREWWITCGMAHRDIKTARQAAIQGYPRTEIVHVREVLDEGEEA